MSYLREKLAADNRFRMSLTEFEQLLVQNEVPRQEGMEFLEALHTAGLVLYYPHRSPDWIYLKPRAITRELLHLLDPDGTIAGALMRNKTANLEQLEQEYAALKVQKDAIDAVASLKGSRWTKVMMGAVVVQAAVMARLIWWDLSWDVMEPIAYLLGFAYVTMGWAYYTIAKEDIAEYGSLAGRYIATQREKLYKQKNFSLERYNAVADDIVKMKATLKAYGVVTKADKKDYPIALNVTQEKQ